MSAAGDVIRQALAKLSASQTQANALNELRLLEAMMEHDQRELERLSASNTDSRDS